MLWCWPSGAEAASSCSPASFLYQHGLRRTFRIAARGNGCASLLGGQPHPHRGRLLFRGGAWSLGGRARAKVCEGWHRAAGSVLANCLPCWCWRPGGAQERTGTLSGASILYQQVLRRFSCFAAGGHSCCLLGATFPWWSLAADTGHQRWFGVGGLPYRGGAGGPAELRSARGRCVVHRSSTGGR